MKYNSLLKVITCVCLSLSSLNVAAAPKTAALEATSRSLYQSPITWVASGVGTVETFFTTYDGMSGLPLFDRVSAVFSGEVRPRVGQPTLFEADYLNFNVDFGILAYGSTTFVIPVGDSDQNTLPDVFEFKKGGIVSYTGTIQADYPSARLYTTRGTFSKRVGEFTIANSLTVSDSAGAVVLQGTVNMRMGYFSGIVNYTRASGSVPQTMDLTVTGVLFDSIPLSYTGSTPFTVVNANTLSIPSFVARRADGVTIQVYPMTLSRKGNKYLGEFEISDGNLSTSWRDYKTWVLELTDANDSDSNGIPDLSDALKVPPTITIQPKSGSFSVGSTVALSVTAVGDSPLSYQWQLNGVNVPGATTAVLNVFNAQISHGGKYRVIISNGAGTITSDEAVIAIVPIPPPELSIMRLPDKRVRISWPSSAGNYSLEFKTLLSPSSWSTVRDSGTTANGVIAITLPANQNAAFFRLRAL